MTSDIDRLSITTARMLAVDGVEAARSGHPGLPLGAAPLAYTIFLRHLRFDPTCPEWPGRDRFILSAGHGSMLLYALLNLFGYNLPISELERFRQWGSKTPGHPEYGHTVGVETTTGPLGQGFATGVGMAMAARHWASRLGGLMDFRVFALVSDGDLMEGVASEAASFAGHHRLGRLIYLYDDNGITIDGPTSITFAGEDVGRRFEAYGWHVQAVEGRDHEGIHRAIEAAKADPRPSLVRVKTVIGYGAPRKAGTSAAHGAPLGDEELAGAKRALGWPEEPRFLVPDDVAAFFGAVVAEKQVQRRAWQEAADRWRAASPIESALLDTHLTRWVPQRILERLLEAGPGADATRKLSSAALNRAAPIVPSLVGGSADLAESNLTDVKGGGGFSAATPEGRNLHFGIREHAMGAIANGLAYDGLFIPYVATFLQFADYMRPAVRLAALARLQAIYIWTHDSIFLGEDGPTHQPVEHLSALRCIPNLHVVRPVDAEEVAVGWAHALTRRDGPTALILTRQKLAPVERPGGFDAAAAQRGGYVVRAPAGERFAVLATGSEVPLVQAALALLEARGLPGRLVSVPCLACFAAQPADWHAAVLPPGLPRAAVEAATGVEWWRLVGSDGLVIGIDRFGASGPEKALAEAYGFTPPQVAERLAGWLAGRGVRPA